MVKTFDAKCQKSIIELYIYMSTSLDQILNGTLPMEEYNQKVEELVSSLTDNCQSEIEEIIKNPEDAIKAFIALSKSDSDTLKEIPDVLRHILAGIIESFLYIAGFGDGFDWKDNLPQYLPCFLYGGEVLNLIGEVVKDFRKETVRGVLEALQDLLPLYDTIPEYLKACQEANQKTLV
eukprot:CAMPEP_0114590736 /NCGR_PEP_ID=MMETSP0125-20121206/12940_1 /TAXON_ID=485358 ORGANISM="Aristerostoma sp., Strain ATCC 50986" /NCGR_SAMPLE_ID=MMETSP0125 /ASSEMBLY_ACC=CAM_ASM_000245 /LENGTH=177 /DNA_ID=CAMNT_0001788433 /DNA_START=116 /DNA_END=649 /DNA_ORIENTATION=+